MSKSYTYITKAMVIFSLFLLTVTSLSSISALKANADAKAENIQASSSNDSEGVDKLADMLSDVYNHTSFDKDGVEKSIDVNYLSNKYGNVDQLNDINSIARY
jgi:peptidoglycan hydrolase CwlO-like protein